MVVHSNLSTARPQPAQPSSARSAAQSAGNSSPANALTDFSLDPEIASPDEAARTTERLRDGIANQSVSALFAQANHSPETVLALLQQ
jgi:hypothetical protein